MQMDLKIEISVFWLLTSHEHVLYTKRTYQCDVDLIQEIVAAMNCSFFETGSGEKIFTKKLIDMRLTFFTTYL